jgi:hypothetical protein
LAAAMRTTLAEWLGLRWTDLRFMETPTTVLALVLLFALSMLVLLWGTLRRRQPERTHLALPAILPVMRRTRLAALRYAPFVVFLLGIPFFAMALADPRIVLTREAVNRSGRRVAILIDASGSMILPFEAPKLKPEMDRAFYVAVAAAGEFLKLRKDGGHSDVVALIEFGNEAYVVTPFTTDYENVQVSATLIGNPRAWNRFNVFGTTIIQGLEQGLQLFRTFGMMKASGNLIVIFSDGNDGETNFRGRTLEDFVTEARTNDIPMYMVRLGYQKPLGDVPYDALWKPAMERTGGGFYPAHDETSLLRAVREIDRRSEGRIDIRHFSTERPGFAGYALLAISLWVVAGVLKLGVRSLRTFP